MAPAAKRPATGSVKPAGSSKAKAAKAASVRPASGTKAGKPASAKAAAAAGVNARPPFKTRPPDPAQDCRMGLFDGYRKACHAKTAACPAAHQAELAQCSKFGVGSEHWPLDLWPLPQQNQDALKAAGMNFRKGRKCLSQVWWKLHEADLKACGPTLRSLSRAKRGVGAFGSPGGEFPAPRAPTAARAAAVASRRTGASAKKPKSGFF
jgi:hypothetical protein